jgi:calcium permeable stress-gated cation channel
VQGLEIREAKSILIADAMPICPLRVSKASFFMTFLLLKALSESPQQILQLPRIIVRWLLRTFFSKTPRQLASRDAPPVPDFFSWYAFAEITTVIGMCYMTVSPLVIPCCFLYFVVHLVVISYDVSFTRVPPFGAGGSLFTGAQSAHIVALITQQIVMLGMYTLRGQATLSTISFIMIVCLCGFKGYVKTRFGRVIRHGSYIETQQADEVDPDGKGNIITHDAARMYLHPGMEPLPEVIENLNGVTTERNDDIGAGPVAL